MYVTNLVDVTNIRVRRKSRQRHKYSCTSQIASTSQVFEYVTNLLEAERHLKKRNWDHLDRYLPREVNSAIKINARRATLPWTYMYSWQWRTTVKLMQQDLFQALGDLVQRL